MKESFSASLGSTKIKHSEHESVNCDSETWETLQIMKEDKWMLMLTNWTPEDGVDIKGPNGEPIYANSNHSDREKHKSGVQWTMIHSKGEENEEKIY